MFVKAFPHQIHRLQDDVIIRDVTDISQFESCSFRSLKIVERIDYLTK